MLTIELPPQAEQTEFNLRRWTELQSDPELAKFDWRIETNRYGHVIVMPPPAPKHGMFQIEIGARLWSMLPDGKALSECPISTADGVKGADVAWASRERLAALGDQSCFPQAPEICVEIMSPDNTDAEIREKLELYLDAGAKEVWVCSQSGEMSFFGQGLATLASSALCPSFPKQLAS